jgi:predicted dehydrogenase
MVKIVILGTGSIGLRHLRILDALSDVDVTAIPVRPERVPELSSQGFQAAERLEDVLPVDGVIVATNTGRHLQDAQHAINAGAHVLIEKPLAPSTQGVRSLLELAQAKHRKVFTGYCLRFDPSLQMFRQNLNEIGPIYAVEISCRSYLADWRPGRNYRKSYAADQEEGGVLRDLSHEIDYALWLFGLPQEVTGFLSNSGRLKISSEDQAALFWRTNESVQVCIHLDYLAKPPVRYMKAFGAAGWIELDLIKRLVTIHTHNSTEEHRQVQHTADQIYIDQSLAFIAAIEGNDSKPLATGREGFHALAIADAARRSSSTQKTEKVSLF